MTYGLRESRLYGVCWPCERKDLTYGRQTLLSQFPDCLILSVCLHREAFRPAQLTDIDISSKEIAGLGLFASILGHIGDGNFHSSIMFNRSDPVELARVEKVVHDMVDRAIEMEGSCTVCTRCKIY